MSTMRDIVRRALRLVAGETGVPDGEDGADACQRLQSVILDIPGFIHNGTWRRDRYVTTGSYTARESDRIIVTSPGVVTLPTVITGYGYPCPRQPIDLAKVQITWAANAGLWLYSATKAAWGRADGLQIENDHPFGPEDDDGLAAQLAVALLDEFGGEISAATTAKSNQSKASLRARFKKAVPRDCMPRDYV